MPEFSKEAIEFARARGFHDSKDYTVRENIKDTSKYDYGNPQGVSLEEARALNQGKVAQGVNILGKMATTFGGAVAENAGVLLSLPGAVGNQIADAFMEGDQYNFIGDLTSNDFIKSIESVREEMINNMPVYLSAEQQKDTGLVDYLTTPNKFFDDLGQGVGFLAAQFVPMSILGNLTKSATFLSKIGKAGKALDEAGVVSKFFESKTLKALSTLDEGTKAKMVAEGIDLVELENAVAKAQRLVEKVGAGTGAVMGRLGESAMESNQTFDETKKALLKKGMSEQEADKVARDQANNVFIGNLGLAALDMQQYKSIFGSVSKAAKKGLQNDIIDEASKRVTINNLKKYGVEATASKFTKGEKLANYLWRTAETSGSEGLEELIQYDFQETAKELALSNTPRGTVDSLLEFIGKSGANLPKSLTELEGQKAAMLGAILGGGATALSTMGQEGKIEQEAQRRADIINNSLSYQKDKVDPTKRYRDENGTKVLNEAYLNSLNEFTRIEEKKRIAEVNNNPEEVKRLNDLQLFSQVLNFSRAGKIDELENYYDNLAGYSKTELSRELRVSEEDMAEPQEVLAGIKNKINKYATIYNDISSDPTLSALSDNGKKLAAYKIATYEINKESISNVNAKIAALELDNQSSLLEAEVNKVEAGGLSNRTALEQDEKNLKGLNPLQQKTLIEARKNKEKLVKENAETLDWYEKVRKPENLQEFNEKLNQYEFTKKKDAVEKATRKNVDQDLKDFYDNNTVEDESGFDSASIEVLDNEGKVMETFSLEKGNPTMLHGTDPKVKMSVRQFLSTKKYDENGDAVFTYGDNEFKYKIKDVYQKRVEKVNSKLNAELVAKTHTIKKLYETAVAIKNKAISGLQTDIDTLYDELFTLLKNRDEDVKGNRKKTNTKIYARLTEQIKEREAIYESKIEELTKLKESKSILKEEAIQAQNEVKALREQVATSTTIITELPFKKRLEDNLDNLIKEEDYLNSLLDTVAKAVDFYEKEVYDLHEAIKVIKRVLNSVVTDFKLSDAFAPYIASGNKELWKALNEYDSGPLVKYFESNLKTTDPYYDVVTKLLNDIYVLSEDLSSYEQRLSEAETSLKAAVEKQVETKAAYDVYKKELNKKFNWLEYEIRVFNFKLAEAIAGKLPEYIGSEPILKNKKPETKSADDTTFSAVDEFFKSHPASEVLSGIIFSSGNDSTDDWSDDVEAAKHKHNPNINKRTFYRWIENVGSKLEPSSIKLKVVNINDAEYGINGKSTVYGDTKKEGVTHNEEDLRFVIVDAKTGKPVYYGGNIVSGSLPTSTTKFNTTSGESVDRFHYGEVNTADKAKLEASIKSMIEEFRTQVKTDLTSNKPVILSVDYIFQGTKIKDSTNNNLVGTLVDTKEEITDVELDVVTTEPYSLRGRGVKLPLGIVLFKGKGNTIPLITRKLNNGEAKTALALVKAMLKAKKDGVKEPEHVRPVKDGPTLETALSNLVWLGSESNKPFYINTEGDLITVEGVFSTDEVLSGKSDDRIIKYLQDKPLQVNKYFVASNKPHNEMIWDGKEFKLFTWKSYRNYLIEPRTNGEQSPLTTNVKPKVARTEEQTLLPSDESGRRFQNGYMGIRTPKVSQNPPVAKEEPKGEFVPVAKGSKISSLFGSGVVEPPAADPAFNQVKPNTKISSLFGAAPDPNAAASENPAPTPAPTGRPKPPTLNRTLVEGETLVDVTNQIKEVSDWLGINIEVTKGLIAPGVVGRVLHNGRVLVSQLAVEGTPYHEAWHYVSNFLLSAEEQAAIFDKYAKQKGLESATKLEVEEAIAEDFRTYALTGKLPYTETKTMFDKIISFFKQLFGMGNEPSIEKLFSDIRKGAYRNAPKVRQEMDYNALNMELATKIAIPMYETRTLHTHYVEALIKRPELLFNLHTEIGDEVMEEAIEAFKAETKITNPARIALIREEHNKLLRTFGLDSTIKFDDESISEEEKENIRIEFEQTKSQKGEGYREAFLSSQKAGLLNAVKILVSGIRDKNDTYINGEYYSVAADFNKLINKLQNKLANSTSWDEMRTILQTGDAEMQDIAGILGTINPTRSPEAVKLITAFYCQFAKSRENYYKLLVGADGTMYHEGSDRRNKINTVKSGWINNIAEQSKHNPLLVNSNNRISVTEAFVADSRRPLNLLNAIGVNITDSAMDKLEKANPDAYRLLLADMQDIVTEIKKNNDITELFSGSQKARIEKLVEAEAAYGDEVYELQHTTPMGEVAYDVTYNSFYTNILNNLMNGVTTMFSNDPYAQDSKLLERVRKGAKIKRAITEGFQEGNGSKGVETNKASFTDFLKNELYFTLNNVYSLLITGDKKTPRAFELDKPLFEVDSRDNADSIVKRLTDELYNYYLTEEKVAKKRKPKGAVHISGEEKLNSVKDASIFTAMLEDVVIKSETNVKNAIRTFVTKEIVNTRELFKDNNVIVNNFIKLDKNGNTIKSVLGKSSFSANDLVRANEVETVVATFVANNMISAIEQTKIFFGHPSYYKDFIDMFKRFAGAIATKKTLFNDSELLNWMNTTMPRIDGKKRDGKINAVVFNDIKGINKELESLGHTKIDETDAYGLCLDDDYRDIMFQSGDWTTQQEATWQKESVEGWEALNEGRKPEYADLNDSAYSTLPAQKLIVNGTSEDNQLKPVYFKFAVLRLNPAFIHSISEKNEDGTFKTPALYTMYKQMQEKQIGLSVFKSGNKVGTIVDGKGKTQDFYTEKGAIAPINNKFVMSFDMTAVGIQVENKPKEELSVPRGTQMEAIIGSNQYQNGESLGYTTKDGRKVTDVIEESMQFQNDLTDLLVEEVEKRIGLSKDSEGRYTYADKGEELRKSLVDEAKRRNSSSNVIDGINIVFDYYGHNEVAFLDLLSNKEKVQNILASIVENSVVNQARNGLSAVQFPSTGFETGLRVMDGEQAELDPANFYKDSITGRTYMEVYLPNFLEEYLGQDSFDLQNLDPKILEMVGFRIPTEQLNSIDAVRVKGFLPRSMGNTVIVPGELSKKVGSDYDFDKLNLYYPNFIVKYNNRQAIKDFVKAKGLINNSPITSDNFYTTLEIADAQGIEFVTDEEATLVQEFKEFRGQKPYKSIKYVDRSFLKSDSVSVRKKALENALTQNHIDVLSSASNREALLRPNSIDDIKSIADEISKAKTGKTIKEINDGYKYSGILSFSLLSQIRNRFWTGKDLVGIFALHNKNHPLAQKAGIGIMTMTLVDEQEVDYDVNFAGIEKDEYGAYPLGRVFAVGENGKDKKNEYISNTLGQGVSTAVDVAKNPDILPTLNLNLITADVWAFLLRIGVDKDRVAMFITQPAIIDFVKAIDANNVLSIPKNERQKKSEIVLGLKKKYPIVSSGVKLTKEMLKDSLTDAAFSATIQGQVLEDFLNYQESARHLSDFQSSMSFDTKGFKNVRTAAQAVDFYNKVKESDKITNREKYEESFLSSFKKAYERVGNREGDNKDGYYKTLMLTENNEYLGEAVNNLLKLKKFFNENNNNNKDREKASTVIDNYFLHYLLTTTPFKRGTGETKSMYDEFDRLFKGDNSVAKRLIAYVKANPQSSLTNMVTNTDVETGVQNIQLFTKKLSAWEEDAISSELHNLFLEDKDFVGDIIKMALMQSGFDYGAFNIMNILPAQVFVPVAHSIIENLSTNIDVFEDFKKKLFQNNYFVEALAVNIKKGKSWSDGVMYISSINKDGTTAWWNNRPYITSNEKQKDGTFKVLLFKNVGDNRFEQLGTLGNGNRYKWSGPVENKPVKVAPVQMELSLDGSKPINIYAGTNENADLSNFAVRPFTYKGIEFKSVEQAFQYTKVLDYAKTTTENNNISEAIMETIDGGRLRYLGSSRTVTGLDVNKWDSSSSRIMKELLMESFKQNASAKERLIATGGSVLTHTQESPKSKWRTEFPKLLMEVRAELGGRKVQSKSNQDVLKFLKEVEVRLKTMSKEAQKKILQGILGKTTNKGISDVLATLQANLATGVETIEEQRERLNKCLGL